MSFRSSAFRFTSAIALTLAAASVIGCVSTSGEAPTTAARTVVKPGELVVTQLDGDIFQYSIASVATGAVDADRAKVMADASKLAAAMGADGYAIVSESSQTFDGAFIRYVDVKLNGKARQTASRP